MSDEAREPSALNVEGSPTLVYVVWSWEPPLHYSTPGYPLGHEGLWHFHGRRVLSLREVLQYRDFGYHVERSHRDDRGSTIPLFPRLDFTGPDPEDRLD